MGATADLEAVASDLLSVNLGATHDETLAVVCDTPMETIGRAFFDAGVTLGLETGMVMVQPRERSGQEPPPVARAAMTSADIVVCPTSTSYTHTRAREAATDAGARVATMPGVTNEMFADGAIKADYEAVADLTSRVAEALTDAAEASIESHGETFTVSIEGRSGISSDGMIREPGSYGNLPSGEAYLAPVEGTGTGTLVVDGGFAGQSDGGEVVITVEDGRIVDVAGSDPPAVFSSGPPCAREVAELGIGTNPAARLIGTVLEDEKAYGTCHVAFGDNAGFGGKIDCDSHLDGVLVEPTVRLDGEVVLADGEVVV